uniref:Uncharacterized protein n=1 Tax=Aegilops tauschii subsp. strangulata TaxID=200361 RepID=A0A453D9T9_AEGTS
MSFYSYERYKKLLGMVPGLDDPNYVSVVRLLGGGLAGVTAASVTYPLDVVRTRLATQIEVRTSIDSTFMQFSFIDQGRDDIEVPIEALGRGGEMQRCGVVRMKRQLQIRAQPPALSFLHRLPCAQVSAATTAPRLV